VVATALVDLDGPVQARGLNASNAPGGAGGAITLAAPVVRLVNGQLKVNGGPGAYVSAGSAYREQYGGGRIAEDEMDLTPAEMIDGAHDLWTNDQNGIGLTRTDQFTRLLHGKNRRSAGHGHVESPAPRHAQRILDFHRNAGEIALLGGGSDNHAINILCRAAGFLQRFF